ncbi:ATP-binding protein [Nocardioides marmoraquaticus]
MFTRVLVANRGEIALRVFRTCRDLGVETVAVHTDLDARAPHVRAADVAMRVESYLDVDAVVAAAVSSGADAVHPGYGFLSERSTFARAVTDAGLVFVGPSAEVIELMGRKDAAREVAERAGVPVVPAYDMVSTSSTSGGPSSVEPVETTDTSGWVFPVLVKAAAGGGGKGMRVVRAAADLSEAVAAARREATAAFGDDAMLVEKYVERGRHVEVQVVGDGRGGAVHFGTRDCSAQRRHQKVVEEAPAPDLPPETRALLHRAAVDLAAEVSYAGAGTVEFLLDVATGDVYFLEMNTRLQVEHPVTELVTGTDLVALQLRVAAGEAEALTGLDEGVEVDGHAMEVRVYAEDPYAGFLPQAGRATTVRWPHGSGVRVDHALEDGQVVSTAYDPMLGKVVVHAADREAARRGLVRALEETAVLGLTTNVGFLRELVASDAFRDGEVDTAWLDRHELTAPDPAPARRAAARAVLAAEGRPGGPWRDDGFRLGADAAPVVVDLDEPVVLEPADLTGPVPVAAVSQRRVEVVHLGQRHVLERPDPFADTVAAIGEGTVAAPMPGTVLDVRVGVGDVVEAGQVLGTLEAMKMELALTAGVTGTVAAVGAAAGDQVALGAALFEVTPDA